MPFNAPKRSNLQIKLIEAIETLIADKQDFEKQFIRICKLSLAKGKSGDLSPQELKLLSNHAYKTFIAAIDALYTKEIFEDDHQKVRDVIFTIAEAHSWITALPERNEKLRNLANECMLKIALNAENQHKAKSRK